ncbi:hypothetical protein H9N28_10115 [Rhodobacter capsulatus]|uniref:hypothetical protein n=1 Tax=Rhodobacter capsulatus TaxID=1061 RepID=UPI0006DC98CF|nr:hypothetical protein [Rhodobacter capsulatus]KQB12541.1 hypothetical protein AP071_07070 [Rhodobacter capsulatus]KQB16695.1 hypothetical protein AP073_10395 [Rhodobacter capsulatus]PZX26481.1 hypothetical protein LY44_01177 [Rhodobacter capsulatus]QNR61965.1 hypothetical protein H9N28_10115 [Rhodobacter capsulatus]
MARARNARTEASELALAIARRNLVPDAEAETATDFLCGMIADQIGGLPGIRKSREWVKAASAAEEARHRTELIAAQILTQEEADALERKAERTEGEALLLEAHRIRQALNVPAITAVLDFWDRGAAVRRLDRFGAARGIVPAHDDGGDTLARRRYWKACARAYGHLFQSFDLTDGEWLNDDTAGGILDRVMAQCHLLAHLGRVLDHRPGRHSAANPVRQHAHSLRMAHDPPPGR